MVTRSEAARWGRGLDEMAGRIASRFARAEPRRRAVAHLRGLLAPVERKSGWQLAEAAGAAPPDGVQDFLSRMRWDADAVRDDLVAWVVERLGDDGAVLVLDETGFLEKGTKSAGVGRQYTGPAGRIGNAQVGVFLGCASRHGRALPDRALHLPKDWAEDAARRRGAGIPDEVVFTTKPKLGLGMLEQAGAAGVPFPWIGWHRHVTLATLAAVRKAAAGGCGPRQPRHRPAAADRARDQTTALGTRRLPHVTAHRRPALVSLAPKTSAAPPPRAPAQTNAP